MAKHSNAVAFVLMMALIGIASYAKHGDVTVPTKRPFLEILIFKPVCFYVDERVVCAINADLFLCFMEKLRIFWSRCHKLNLVCCCIWLSGHGGALA